MHFSKNRCLSTIYFSEEDILKVITSLDPNKAHGHDNISIRMMKLCDKEICKPLHMIFVSCMEEGISPLLWKIANVVPAHDKRSIKNYRPVSLLPIFGKIFERLLYNPMYSFFIENNLISLNQSGFRQGDSCTNQLISITHEIYRSMAINGSSKRISDQRISGKCPLILIFLNKLIK